MMNIIIHADFWDSSITQFLRLRVPNDIGFQRTFEKDAPDLYFPFANEISFVIVWSEQLDSTVTISRISSLTNKLLIIIGACEEQDNERYSSFVSHFPKIHSIVCFPIKNFANEVSKWIWATVSNTKGLTKQIGSILEQTRIKAMNPLIQADFIITHLVKDEKRRNEILYALKGGKKTTLRKELIKKLPELFEMDFYLEPNDY